ncbi:MAG TPA: DUF2442 domain-containing protein [Acidobacteriaceae bacterium]
MSTSAIQFDSAAVDVVVDEAMLRVTLADGRELAVPIEWFPRLRNATPEQRKRWRMIGRGDGIHWEDVDEDISVRTLLRLG